MTTERLALGTVQFGLPYGVANRNGRVSLTEAARILDIARTAGLDTLDTAIGYGDSEARLGQIGVTGWRIVSKLPELPESVDDVAGWVESSVAGSLERLGVGQLHGLLLHRPRQLAGVHGDGLLAALIGMRESGLTRRIGISVYGPDDLDAVWVHGFDLVQAPYNILDRRLSASGWLDRLADAGVEVHTRSTFLQGLLLMRERPAEFDRWTGLFDEWEDWLEARSMTAVQACIGFALAQVGISRVVVGVDSTEQLAEILETADQTAPAVPDTLACDDSGLIDPSRWEIA